jgi:hypothetical protein
VDPGSLLHLTAFHLGSQRGLVVAVLGGALAQPHIAAAPSIRLLFRHPPKALPIHQDDFGASMILWPPFQFEPLVFLHIFSLILSYLFLFFSLLVPLLLILKAVLSFFFIFVMVCF